MLRNLFFLISLFLSAVVNTTNSHNSGNLFKKTLTTVTGEEIKLNNNQADDEKLKKEPFLKRIFPLEKHSILKIVSLTGISLIGLVLIGLGGRKLYKLGSEATVPELLSPENAVKCTQAVQIIREKNKSLSPFDEAIIAIYLTYQGRMPSNHWVYEVKKNKEYESAKTTCLALLGQKELNKKEERKLAINFIRLLMHQNIQGISTNQFEKIKKALATLCYLNDKNKKMYLGCEKHENNFYLDLLLEFFLKNNEKELNKTSLIKTIHSREPDKEFCGECQGSELLMCALGLDYFALCAGSTSSQAVKRSLNQI